MSIYKYIYEIKTIYILFSYLIKSNVRVDLFQVTKGETLS